MNNHCLVRILLNPPLFIDFENYNQKSRHAVTMHKKKRLK